RSRMDVARNVARWYAPATQCANGQMGKVLADTLALRPRLFGIRRDTCGALHVRHLAGHPRKDRQGRLMGVLTVDHAWNDAEDFLTRTAQAGLGQPIAEFVLDLLRGDAVPADVVLL